MFADNRIGDEGCASLSAVLPECLQLHTLELSGEWSAKCECGAGCMSMHGGGWCLLAPDVGRCSVVTAVNWLCVGNGISESLLQKTKELITASKRLGTAIAYSSAELDLGMCTICGRIGRYSCICYAICRPQAVWDFRMYQMPC